MRLAAFMALVSLTVGCSGSSKTDADPPLEPGCSAAPQCGDCATCFESCTCKGGDTSSCADQCSGTGGSAGATGSGGSSGAGGAGTGGLSGVQTVTIKTSPRSLAPGEEAFFCQNFSNPFGQDVEVLESESFMTPGSHHMFVFYGGSVTDGPVHDCSGLEFKKPLHTAQTPQHLTKYPAGVGRVVNANTGLRISAHYFNTSSKPVEAVITATFKVVSVGSLTHQAGSLFFLNPNIFVEPFQTGKATETCTLPSDVNVIDVVSHMHSFSTNFEAKTDAGKVVYEGTEWDDPKPNVFTPPLALSKGTKITYTCDYKNTLSTPLTFGESAETNEMCILSGTYFPAPNGTTLDCQ
ncbi:MAG TPA: hypothetical protein PKD61_03655 [Polyangiaceae bacterium]|nr:hypothetical protein [Polyangiaceae bacterium]